MQFLFTSSQILCFRPEAPTLLFYSYILAVFYPTAFKNGKKRKQIYKIEYVCCVLVLCHFLMAFQNEQKKQLCKIHFCFTFIFLSFPLKVGSRIIRKPKQIHKMCNYVFYSFMFVHLLEDGFQN